MGDFGGYYHAAYAAAVIIYAAYGASLWWRTRRVRGRLARVRGAPGHERRTT